MNKKVNITDYTTPTLDDEQALMSIIGSDPAPTEENFAKVESFFRSRYQMDWIATSRTEVMQNRMTASWGKHMHDPAYIAQAAECFGNRPFIFRIMGETSRAVTVDGDTILIGKGHYRTMQELADAVKGEPYVRYVFRGDELQVSRLEVSGKYMRFRLWSPKFWK